MRYTIYATYDIICLHGTCMWVWAAIFIYRQIKKNYCHSIVSEAISGSVCVCVSVFVSVWCGGFARVNQKYTKSVCMCKWEWTRVRLPGGLCIGILSYARKLYLLESLFLPFYFLPILPLVLRFSSFLSLTHNVAGPLSLSPSLSLSPTHLPNMKRDAKMCTTSTMPVMYTNIFPNRFYTVSSLTTLA